MADQGLEFGIEGFEVNARIVLGSFGGFGGRSGGGFDETGCRNDRV